MNSLNFTGNVGRDAETRFTPNSDAITSFSVALTSGYGDKKITTWLNCTIFGKRGEALADYIKKGAQVGISGEFAARPYTTKEGAEKLSLDVGVNDLTLLGGKREEGGKSPTAQSKDPMDFEDSIPF